MTRNSQKNPLGSIGVSAFCFAYALPFFTVSAEAKGSVNSNGVNNPTRNYEKSKISKSFTPDAINQNWVSQDWLIADNHLKGKEKESEKEIRVLIAEVVFQGLEDHPDRKRLEIAAYDAMTIRPESKVTREDVQKDLDSIYSTGWFSGVRIESLDSPLGVQLLVKVDPNPVLRKVDISSELKTIPPSKIDEIFLGDYGKTLNFNTLKSKIKEVS